MADIKKLIEAAIEKKPLDIKHMIDEIMTEKVRGVVTETVQGFEYADEQELTEEEELATFFEEFHEEYGHLPEEEQFAIMNELTEEEELNEVTHHQVQLEVSHDDEDKQVDLQHRGKQDSRGKKIHTKFVTVRATPDEDENASLVAAAKHLEKDGYRIHGGQIHSTFSSSSSVKPTMEKEEFFAAFQEEYGHLPLEEQEAIMANLVENEGWNK